MLKKFSVTNFKNFRQTAELVLDQPANYEFNQEIIQNGCVTKGIFYGINGSGKSNLALALFDIVLHLTDKEKALDQYEYYLNLTSNKPIAEFEYIFEFNGIEVKYKYGKRNALSLVYESLSIGGEEVLNYDFRSREGYSGLKGSETLQLVSDLATEEDKLSRVKYVKNNAILENNATNVAFISFISFVENMLMFYSLDSRRYQGLTIGPGSFTKGIIEFGKMKEFEAFLHSQGVDYELVAIEEDGNQELYCKFKNKAVPFIKIASTGTRSLALFYYWYSMMEKASFVFVDEYDAFYHFELSQELVKLVKGLTKTQVFFSTHNTALISNELLRPDAYFRIKDNQICSFDQTTGKELRRAHNLEKMYKAGSFNE